MTSTATGETRSTTFDHTFSGWSVWVEPCPDESATIHGEMASLAEQCGGPQRGMHKFAPHCTLLYNFPRPPQRERSSNTGNKKTDRRLSEQGVLARKMLQRCVDVLEVERHSRGREEEVWNEGEVAAVQNNIGEKKKLLELCPTSFYYFPYPKAADNGRGFGCVISMLLLRNTPLLQLLHDVVKKVFPADERHGDGEKDGNGKGRTFIPHMALVYAPESEGWWLQRRTDEMERDETCRRRLLKPLRARYLSLWSTEGRIEDWHLIERVELP